MAGQDKDSAHTSSLVTPESPKGRHGVGSFYRAALERLRPRHPPPDADEMRAGREGMSLEESEPTHAAPSVPAGQDSHGEQEKQQDRKDEHHYAYLHQTFSGEPQPAPAPKAEDVHARPGREPREWSVEMRRLWTTEPYTADEVMSRKVRCVQPEESAQEAARVMREVDCGVVPVVDEQHRLLGLLTDRDIVVRAVADDRVPSQTVVRDIMTQRIEAVTPDTTIYDVLSLMGREQIRRVPVVEDGDRLVGIIALADIALKAEFDAELQHALDKISARKGWKRRAH